MDKPIASDSEFYKINRALDAHEKSIISLAKVVSKMGERIKKLER